MHADAADDEGNADAGHVSAFISWAHAHEGLEPEEWADRVWAFASRLRDGGVIRSDTWGTGKAGVVSVEADHLVISGYGNTGITSDARALRGGTNRGATSPAGSVTVTANTLELHDFGKISSNTDTVGKAGSVTIRADRLLILGSGGERAEEGEYTGITTNARTGSTGAAGDVMWVPGAQR